MLLAHAYLRVNALTCIQGTVKVSVNPAAGEGGPIAGLSGLDFSQCLAHFWLTSGDGRRVPYHQAGLKQDLRWGRVGLFFAAQDAAENHLSGSLSHVPEGLLDRRQATNLIGGALDVVEAEDRNVFGHTQAELVQGTDCAHRADVVKGKQRRKLCTRHQ